MKNVFKIENRIYITSNEKIKKDDWYISWQDYYNPPRYVLYVKSTEINGDGKKIILTTDADLVADGIKCINDESVKWIVDNPNCEYVEIFHQDVYSYGKWDRRYKIIIPQEEPKKESLSYEDFRKRASTKLLELFDNDYSRFSDEESCDDNHFYAHCIYWESKLKGEEKVKDLTYWRNNCEENYMTTPISVLKYITELEKALNIG